MPCQDKISGIDSKQRQFKLQGSNTRRNDQRLVVIMRRVQCFVRDLVPAVANLSANGFSGNGN